MTTVAGLFDHYDTSEHAVNTLTQHGIPESNISVITRDGKQSETGEVTAGKGAATGAATGGVLGLLAGLTSLIIPGIGPVIATGSIASAIGATLATTAVGAGVGAATGGLLGALMEAGISHEDASFYAEGVKRGGILVTVQTNAENEAEVQDILSNAGAVDMKTRRASWEDEGWTKFETTQRDPEERYKKEPFRK